MGSANPISFYLPLVDISPFLKDPSSPAAQRVVDDVRLACKSTGFFQMTGHGVPLPIQKRIFDASGKFFSLPRETKLKLDARNTVGFRGYDVMETQSYELELGPGPESDSAVQRDMKEGFFASTDFPLDHDRVVSGRFLQGPNVWPEEEKLAHEDFRLVVEEYYSEMKRLAHIVLDLIAATLPYGADVFEDLEADDPMWLLRLLHYPPTAQRGESSKLHLGAGEHTDFGTITLLLQDDHPGLEVQDNQTGEWHGVPPKENVYIVNMADVMSILTGGDYKSSVHRVWNRNTDDRFSVVFFFDGRLDYKLKPLEQHTNGEGDGDAPTIEEHVRARMTGSYSVQKSCE